MKPRMSYYGEGKERTLKVGDKVKTFLGEGTIKGKDETAQYYVVGDGFSVWMPEDRCIPVEPERVKGVITKVGKVTVVEKDVLVDGFDFDLGGQGGMLDCGRLAGEWAIEQIKAVMEKCTPGGPLVIPKGTTITGPWGAVSKKKPAFPWCVYYPDEECKYGRISKDCPAPRWDCQVTPSPGLLQRMGMCDWPCDWFVVSLKDGRMEVYLHSSDEESARQVAAKFNRRAFRWQEGVR